MYFYFRPAYWCGPKIYDVLSATNEGEKAIKEYNIKYISPKVYGLGLTEYYRKDGFFVVDVEEQGNSIKYSTLKQDNVEKLELKPKFTFEEKYNALFVYLFFLL